MRTSLAKRILGVLIMLICFNTVLLSQEQDKNPIVKSDVVKFIDGKSYYMHEVQKGHTLYSISKVYSIPVEDIIFENPGSKEGIGVGQILKIPVTSREAQISRSKTPADIFKTKSTKPKGKTNIPKPGKTPDLPKQTDQKYFNHIVKAKETLYSISKKYAVSFNALKKANPTLSTTISIGQVIKVPGHAADSKVAEMEKVKKDDSNKSDKEQKFTIHTVSKYETLYGIALKYKQNKKGLTPGSTSNIVIVLINNSEIAREFHLKINTPKGWSQLTDYTSVIVEKASKKLKIFSFYILESTKVGDYTIDIDAYEKSENIKIGTVKIPVYVKPRYEILTKIMKAPEYVFSGDTLSVKFMIQNLSNVEANIQATIINVNVPETRTFTLAPDSLIFTRVFITTVKDIIHYTRNSVSFTASIIESPETKSTISYIFDVIPSDKVKFDSYNRIPVKISGRLVTDDQLGDRKYGAMFDIKGAGMLSKKKMRAVDFHFRGPNRQGNPIFGQTDEYYIKYSSMRSKVVLGDNSYRLTNLTEGSRNGRGVEYKHKFKKLSVGSFINYPRFYPNIKRVFSVFGSYFSGKKFRINAGYLNKAFITDSTAQLITISGEAIPFSWGNIELEYASGMANGKMTMAYSTAFKINYSRYRLFFNYTMADKDFPGYLSNSRYMSTGISTNILRKVNLSVNYNYNHFNIALDTMYANAPFSDNLNFSAGYSLNYNHSISIGINMRGREDRRTPKQFDYKEYTARLTLQSKIKRFGINIYGAIGKTKNLLQLKEGELTNVLNANLTLLYKINKNIFVKSFVSYLGGQQYLTDDFTRVFYGGTINASWNKKMTIVFQYQNNYEVEEYYRDRSLLALDANYLVNRNHEFGLCVNYNLRKNYINNTQLSASLNYTYTINIPVSRTKDIGSLKGKVINNGVDNVEGILFTLAGNIDISDKNGEFDFPYVKTGTHFLFMDNSKSGLNSIAETPGPYKIEILPGQETFFEISLTKSGKITGTIVIEEDENKDKKGFIPVKEEIKNLIIEANNGNEIYRIFTKKDGAFNFEDLRPGQWKVKVYDRGIPKGYKLVTDEYYINLTSGQVKNINVIIKKKSRRIKFQKKF